jgi:type I restriction enzyme R subunit
VVTDRRMLDQQIQTTIKQFMQVGATSATPSAPATCAASSRGQEDHRLDGAEVPLHPRRDRQRARASFAIVIDEAHSSQGGKTSAAMSQALGGAARRAMRTKETPRTR